MATTAATEVSTARGHKLDQIFSLEEEVHVMTEEEIIAKRNKSRLLPYHQRLVNGELPHPEPMFWTHHTLMYKRRMYGRYGEKSGVNPGLIWPTRKELRKMIDFESVYNPFTIQEMVRKKKEVRAAEQAEFIKEEEEIDARMKLLDKYKIELKQKQETKEREILQAKLRREKLMDEVRSHFGYTVDPKDERFQELLAKKEKEQRKAVKEAKKLEKQQRQLEKMEGVEETAKTKPKEKPKKKEDDDDDD